MGRGSTSAGYNPLGFVCASSAYARGATGDGINVGIIDSGVLTGGTTGQSNTTHTDLNDNHANFTSGSDARFNDSTPNDYNGHGTHVAGIVARLHHEYLAIRALGEELPLLGAAFPPVFVVAQLLVGVLKASRP